jgi:periplasmic protein TonB
MIAKKNPRYDLERKRIVLFQIGLMTAGSFTLAAFTYKSPILKDDFKKQVASTEIAFELEEPKEIPKMETPIIKPDMPTTDPDAGPSIDVPSIPTGDVNPIGNTTNPIDPTAGLGNVTIPFGDLNTGTVEIKPEVFEIVDIDAEFIGGFPEMMKFIQSNLVYPQDAIEMGDQGKVYLNFVVEPDGSITNVNIERGVCTSIDREAERIIRSMPKWKPGEMNYGKVRSRVRIPINFLLK